MSIFTEYAKKSKYMHTISGKLETISSGVITDGQITTYDYIEIDSKRYGNVVVVGAIDDKLQKSTNVDLLFIKSGGGRTLIAGEFDDSIEVFHIDGLSSAQWSTFIKLMVAFSLGGAVVAAVAFNSNALAGVISLIVGLFIFKWCYTSTIGVGRVIKKVQHVFGVVRH
ncbi:hypothetical protein ACOYR1_13185 [Thalassotalea piscium]